MAQGFASAGRFGGFGAAKPPSLRGIALTVAAHAAVLPIALSLGHDAIAAPEERLLMVDLAAAPPPPPPPSAPPPPKPQAELLPPPAPGVPPVALPLNPLTAPALPEQAQPQPRPAPAPAAATNAAPVGAPAARPAPASGPATISSNALDTTLIAGAPPRYPHESRRKREQGTVELLVIVGTDGRVEAISIAHSSGAPRLDQAALKAVSGWRWQPVRRDGQAVKVRGIVEIPFLLTSGRKSPSRADCNSADPHCHPDGKPSRGDRRGRMERRDGDIGHPSEDGEE